MGVFAASKGSIMDASIVPVPRQRNIQDDKQTIKDGFAPGLFTKNSCKHRQKDTDARWTTRHGERFFGYKNHLNVDVEHKLIRRYRVTDAAVHDSRLIDALLDEDDTSRDVYTAGAYHSKATGSKNKATATASTAGAATRH